MKTLEYLLAEQTLEPIYHRVLEVYKEQTLENTMKLLIRCKLNFNGRTMLLQMFEHQRSYSDTTTRLKSILNKYMSPRANPNEVKTLKELAENAG